MTQIQETSWDVAVLNASTLALIEYIPRWRSIEISDQLNDVGFGKIEHTISDPFFSSFETAYGQSLFNGNYAIGLYRNSQRVFTFLLEESETQGTLPDETVTFSGRGIACTLEWAITLPEDYARKKKKVDGKKVTQPTFQRDFSSYDIVADLATTSNLASTYANGTSDATAPGVGATLTATSNGALTIDGVAAQTGDTVLVKNQTTTSRNGLYTVDNAGSVSTPWKLTRHANYDGQIIKKLAINRQFYVIYGNTNAGTAWYKSIGEPPTPEDVGDTAITFASLSTSNTGLTAFWILYKEATIGREYSTKFATYAKQVKGTNTGRKGDSVVLPVTLESTISTQKGMQDSNGNIVRDGGNFEVQVGDNLLKVLGQISDQCLLDWHVDGDGVLKITNKPIELSSSVHGTDRTTGANTKLFTLPMMASVTSQVSLKSLKTIAYGSDQNNMSHLRASSSLISKYGTREGFFENSAANAPAIKHITTSALRKAQRPETQVTAKTLEYSGHVAWININVGDKVLVETSVGTFVERVVSAMSVRVTESGQDTEFTFDDVIQDIIKKVNFRTIYGTDNAEIVKGFKRRGNGAKKQPTVTNSSAGVVGLSNRVTVSWEGPTEGNPSQYEVIAYRAGTSFNISAISRADNIATFTTTSAHGLSTNDRVLVRDVAYNRTTPSSTVDTEPLDEYNEYGLIVFAVPTTTTFKVSITGDDESLSWSSNYGTVREILEEHKKIVPGDARTTVIENLASPGSTYQTIIRPMNEFGQAGEISDVATFTASTDPLTLVGGTIQSDNYVAGSAGWSINSNGDAEFDNGIFRGEINATSGEIANWSIDSLSLSGYLDDSRYQAHINTGQPILYGGTYAENGTQVDIYNPRTNTPSILLFDNFYSGADEIEIYSVSRTSGIVTVVTKSNHNLATSGTFNLEVFIRDSILTGLNTSGTAVTATYVSPTSFTYPKAGTNIATTYVTNGFAYGRTLISPVGSTPGNVQISSISRSGSTATVVTGTVHGLSNGDSVHISIRDAGLGAFNTYGTSKTVTVSNTTTFTYTTATSGTVASTDITYGEVLIGASGTDRFTEISPRGATFNFTGDNRTVIEGDQITTGAITTSTIDTTYAYADFGSAAAPSYTFAGDTDTGIYRESTNRISFSTSGTARGFIGTTQLEFNLPIRLGDGTLAAPSFGFTNDTNSGLYLFATDQPAIDANGTAACIFTSTAIFPVMPSTSSTTGYQAMYRNNAFGSVYYFTSSRNIKDNITTVSNSNSIIDALRPVTFTEKVTDMDSPESAAWKHADIQYGFIAEEVAEIANGHLGQYRVDNGNLVPIAWKHHDILAVAIAEIKSLRSRVAQLEAKIA